MPSGEINDTQNVVSLNGAPSTLMAQDKLNDSTNVSSPKGGFEKIMGMSENVSQNEVELGFKSDWDEGKILFKPR